MNKQSIYEWLMEVMANKDLHNVSLTTIGLVVEISEEIIEDFVFSTGAITTNWDWINQDEFRPEYWDELYYEV